jgi:hypothetical protein
MESFLTPLLFFIGHNLNAVARSMDDLAERGKGKVKLIELFSHIGNISSLLIFVIGASLGSYRWYWFLTIFILTRSFYDYTRNALMGLPLNYRGSSLIDYILLKLKMPESYLVMARIIALILAFTFAYRYKI